MAKYVNLTTPLYDRVNAICIKYRYDKREGGYLVEAEPITRDGNGLISKSYCRKYYEHNGDGIALRVKIGRRSAKKEAELEKYILDNAYDIAEKYMQDIKRKLSIVSETNIIKED